MTFLEDIVVGEPVEIGSHTFTAEEIVGFGREWDPQPFHVDEGAARASHFGGLCASGWHTACAWMRVYFEHDLAARAARAEAGLPSPRYGASPGFRDMVWKRPVMAGDRLTYRSTPLDSRILESRPGWGIVNLRNEAFGEDGTLVFAFTAAIFVESSGAAEP